MTEMGRWGNKDASDVDDFTIPLATELGAATIAAVTGWTVSPSGAGHLVIGATANTTTTATVRLSGGTVGTDYTVTVTVTTSDGRTLQRSGKLLVADL